MKYTFDIKKTEITKEESYKNKLFNVYVFSFPRSGSSMMTRICNLLGVNIIHNSDKNKEIMNSRYENMFGSDYHPNPNGFYEIVENQLNNYIDILGTSYSGCKMLMPVTGVRWELVNLTHSKVILLTRDHKEIISSHEAFYGKLKQTPTEDYLRTATAEQIVKLNKANIDYITVSYNNIIKNPKKEIEIIKEFIKSDADIKKAVDFVNIELYRQRTLCLK